MTYTNAAWPVIPTGTDDRLVAIPKVLGRVRRGDVATVLGYVVDRFDRRVEDVDAGRDDWGYANRPVTGGTQPSRHARGLAIDLNATRHPYGKRGTFSAVQVAEVRDMLDDLDDVVRWGGDYSRTKDEMHFEINASPADVARVAARIRADGAEPVDKPIVKPTPSPLVKRAPRPLPAVLAPGATGGWVGLWQGVQRDRGLPTTVDESNGPATQRGTRTLQARWGLAVDGIVGPRTWLRSLLSDESGSLALGDYGADVEVLQNLLGVKLDRNYGPATRDAVRQVQRFLGLPDDGACGPRTVAGLHVHYGV